VRGAEAVVELQLAHLLLLGGEAALQVRDARAQVLGVGGRGA
jgi:hypothetical protein